MGYGFDRAKPKPQVTAVARAVDDQPPLEPMVVQPCKSTAAKTQRARPTLSEVRSLSVRESGLH